MKPSNALRTIKLAHTVIWAFFAGSILAIPIFSHTRHFTISGALAGMVLLEIFVLAFNRWRCPLTDVAARYTKDRSDNFDIYLPLWLAKYNKHIFGALFLLGTLYSFLRWLGNFGDVLHSVN